ncbi:MAG: phosphotransferase [Bacilli bacterium]|nr:phosphotransferase [Bacilli bacterium]
MKLETVIAKRHNKTLYRDGNYCIKVFNEDFKKSDILNEALNQARVEETGLNIPSIIRVTEIDGKWAIISEFIEGKTLSTLMKENPEKKHEYIDMLIDIQIEIQSKKCPLLTKLYDKMNRKIYLADLDANTRFDLHTRLESMPKHNLLCHGDIRPSNIIVTPEGKHYILDWSHATQGNACADAARTYLTFCLQHKDDEAAYYLEKFSEKAGIEKKHLQKWMPIVAASQSVKGNPEEREMLLNWASVVDYE